MAGPDDVAGRGVRDEPVGGSWQRFVITVNMVTTVLGIVLLILGLAS